MIVNVRGVKKAQTAKKAEKYKKKAMA